MRRLGAACAVLAVTLSSSCVETSSTLVPTGDIDAYIVATGTADGIEVSAMLQQNLSTRIDLDGDDELVASAGGESVTLSGGGSRAARLDTPPAEGTEVTVSLTRGEDQDDAPRSTAVLPAPVRISGPAPGSGFDRRRDLRLEIGDVSDELTITWSGTCLAPGPVDAPAAVVGSTVLVPARSVTLQPGGPRRCPVTFTVTRTRQGALDPAFDQGSIIGAQSADIVLRLGGARPGDPPSAAPSVEPPPSPDSGPATTGEDNPSEQGPPWIWVLVALLGGATVGAVAASLALRRRRSAD